MTKIIKKSDITTLIESTMKQAGILKESDVEINEVEEVIDEADIDETLSSKVQSANNEYEEKGMTTEEEDLEESDEDIVSESTNRLAKDASKHNIISENLKKDVAAFNKIINYKY